MGDIIDKIRPLFRGALAFLLVGTVCTLALLGREADPTLSGFAGLAIAFYYKQQQS